MLDIVKSKLKDNYKYIYKFNLLTLKRKELGAIIRNWKNNIYVYNKKTLNSIPEASKIVNKLIKGYFNLYNFKLENNIRSIGNKAWENIRKRKLWSSKIYVSSGQFKHTNDLVNITIYFYNRQLVNYKKLISNKNIVLIRNRFLKRNLFIIRNKGLKFLEKQNIQKNIMINTLNINDISNIEKIENYQSIYYKKYIEKSLAKLIINIYIKQLLYINNYKFNNYYLQNLINIIKKIYKKNIQFNFINLKYFYLNSDILTETLALKIRKNRKKNLRYLNKIILKPKIKELKGMEWYTYKDYYIFYRKLFKRLCFDRWEKNSKLYKFKFVTLDMTNQFLRKLLLLNITKSNYLKKTILKSIKFKQVSGVRLQIAGRLTKRYTASRSISKIRYVGGLVNLYSSEDQRPYALLRGNNRPNLEYTKIKSKTRIGSFGVKGWVSGI